MILKNLTAGATFLLRTAAVTRVGTGPLSPAVAFSMSGGGVTGTAPDRRLASPVQSVVSQVWFIALVGSLVLLALTVLVVALYWRRKRGKKTLGKVPGECSVTFSIYVVGFTVSSAFKKNIYFIDFVDLLL